jgi:hypothetical protein
MTATTQLRWWSRATTPHFYHANAVRGQHYEIVRMTAKHGSSDE